ncbi:hypothetical protein ACMFMG_001453 [Clarireedia jacksonii]
MRITLNHSILLIPQLNILFPKAPPISTKQYVTRTIRTAAEYSLPKAVPNPNIPVHHPLPQHHLPKPSNPHRTMLLPHPSSTSTYSAPTLPSPFHNMNSTQPYSPIKNSYSHCIGLDWTGLDWTVPHRTPSVRTSYQYVDVTPHRKFPSLSQFQRAPAAIGALLKNRNASRAARGSPHTHGMLCQVMSNPTLLHPRLSYPFLSLPSPPLMKPVSRCRPKQHSGTRSIEPKIRSPIA